MHYSIEKLLELGLLSRIPASNQKMEESVRTADSWLSEAKNNLDAGSYRSCLQNSYLAMFHAARAVLYLDGYREKSHFAVARYLEENRAKQGKLEPEWVERLDHYRETRHETQYGTVSHATQKEANDALNAARQFVNRIKKMLEK